MGRHLYKYKLGIAEAVEEHSANIKGFGSLEARIRRTKKPLVIGSFAICYGCPRILGEERQ